MVDQPTAALIGAAIGASGAVTAQIIAAIFAQRTNGKRFEWEQETARRREALEREARFIADKRDLFAKFLAAHSRALDKLADFNEQFGLVDIESLALGDIREPWAKEARQILIVGRIECRRETSLLEQELGLLAPTVGVICSALDQAGETAYAEAAHLLRSAGSSKRFEEGMNAYSAAIDNCRAALSIHLMGGTGSEPT